MGKYQTFSICSCMKNNNKFIRNRIFRFVRCSKHVFSRENVVSSSTTCNFLFKKKNKMIMKYSCSRKNVNECSFSCNKGLCVSFLFKCINSRHTMNTNYNPVVKPRVEWTFFLFVGLRLAPTLVGNRTRRE